MIRPVAAWGWDEWNRLIEANVSSSLENARRAPASFEAEAQAWRFAVEFVRRKPAQGFIAIALPTAEEGELRRFPLTIPRRIAIGLRRVAGVTRQPLIPH